MVLINVGEILVKHSCLSCHLISIENILGRMLDIFSQKVYQISGYFSSPPNLAMLSYMSLVVASSQLQMGKQNILKCIILVKSFILYLFVYCWLKLSIFYCTAIDLTYLSMCIISLRFNFILTRTAIYATFSFNIWILNIITGHTRLWQVDNIGTRYENVMTVHWCFCAQYGWRWW